MVQGSRFKLQVWGVSGCLPRVIHTGVVACVQEDVFAALMAENHAASVTVDYLIYRCMPKLTPIVMEV